MVDVNSVARLSLGCALHRARIAGQREAARRTLRSHYYKMARYWLAHGEWNWVKSYGSRNDILSRDGPIGEGARWTHRASDTAVF